MSKYDDLFAEGGLSLERLRTLVLVADAGGLAKAARGLPSQMSQYSRQIKELEAYFGVALTERRGREIRLNEAARRLLALARTTLDGLSGFSAECAGVERELRVGAGNSVITWWLAPNLGDWQRANPGTRLVCESVRTLDGIARLREMSLDLCVVRGDAPMAGLKRRKLFTLEYRFFVPRALAQGISADQVAAAWFKIPLAVTMGGAFRAHLEDLAAQAGHALRFACECSSFTQAAAVVRAGTAAAILPTIARAELAAADVQDFAFPFLSRLARPLVLAWNPRRSDVIAPLEHAATCIVQIGSTGSPAATPRRAI